MDALSEIRDAYRAKNKFARDYLNRLREEAWQLDETIDRELLAPDMEGALDFSLILLHPRISSFCEGDYGDYGDYEDYSGYADLPKSIKKTARTARNYLNIRRKISKMEKTVVEKRELLDEGRKLLKSGFRPSSVRKILSIDEFF